ncbi:RDD family protein [Massilia antarctica]|uniref:RDD family protein n=1 Tax=Massilia antarctica TaxID=2765360 RepID=A0AA48W5W7_9BURK|nr:RDD family protein [Massilia antarctica]QPI47457.1 RDD family protein [Massilia antarctica]
MLDGRLSLTTPEGVSLQLTPAGPFLRAVAWLLDFLLWAAACLLMRLAMPHGKLGEGIFMLLLFVSYWGYPIISEVYFSGRTLGKRAVGLEVVRSDGLPVGWRESTLRNLMLVADFLPVMYATGLVCMMFDLRFRRLGDIVAGTQVIYYEKAAPRPTPLLAQPLPLPFPLSPDQQRTLVDLFEREAKLPFDRMAELGSIAEALTGARGAESVERMRSYVAGLTQ